MTMCKVTNEEFIRTHLTLTIEELADFLLEENPQGHKEEYYDSNGDLVAIGYDPTYTTTDKVKFDTYNRALEHEISWLSQDCESRANKEYIDNYFYKRNEPDIKTRVRAS